MSEVTPIRGIRPRPELAARIVAPPYDVLDSAEARELADGNPHTWLHVSKPEIDLDAGIDLYDDMVYAKARENYASFLDAGWFIQDSTPCYYIYRLSIGGHSQTGILAGASVPEYEAGLIKKHELTRADKEADRTRHTEVLEAHSGPVFLAYRKQAEIDKLVAAATATPPTYDVTTYDGVRNELWVISNSAPLRAAFQKVPCLYIADGHHRAASYCRVGGARRAANVAAGPDAPHHVFLAVIFPHDQLRILPYNRFVLDLNGLSRTEFLACVAETFAVRETAPAAPPRRHEIAMYLGGRWMGLAPKAGTFDEANPIKSLDVSILQENLLSPILGIKDPRRDKRIDFIGGIRGTGELERRVAEGGGGGVAFSMYPTSLDELMAIADAGEIMPPKSTWFEPKLKDGFVIHSLVEARSPASVR
jgi:uncharacterized protein (DUF1015 family)